MNVYLRDPDVTLYHGDVLETLRELPAESVDCVVTSPPYWGLRDYGTGAWEGGDAECDHRKDPTGGNRHGSYAAAYIRPETGKPTGGSKKQREEPGAVFHDTCGKCGATRIDRQLGLEPTPEQYVERMVEVFREVRRVLAPHGTVWLNLGDSYMGGGGGNYGTGVSNTHGQHLTNVRNRRGFIEQSGCKAKDLVGIPWMVAFALRADGWYLRSDIIWSKPNPMPESVTDRPTKAHEYVFLLSKQPRYFFDQEAVREPHESTRWGGPVAKDTENWKYRNGGELVGTRERDGREFYPNGGRNIRSVWEIATQPYPEAHFATFPEELARRCIAAGCPEQVCRVCGKARERVVDSQPQNSDERRQQGIAEAAARGIARNRAMKDSLKPPLVLTKGFTDCGHADYRPGIVLDPFMGSGTVAHVARKLGRHAVGVDLSSDYLALAARRLQQQSLFAEAG